MAFAGLFGLATLGFAIWSFRHPAGRRRYGLVVAVSCLAMAVANAMMSQGILTTTVDGAAYPNARFLGYFVAFGPIVWLLGTVAGASRRLIAALFVAVYALPGSVLASWNLEEPAATAASGLVFVSILITVALLLGPIYRAATDVSGERRLLYAKLRNLSVTIWAILPVVGVLSEQNLAILTSQTGIFMGTYMDFILLVGIGTLVLRSPTALDHVAGREGGGSSGVSGETASNEDQYESVEVGTLSD